MIMIEVNRTAKSLNPLAIVIYTRLFVCFITDSLIKNNNGHMHNI